MGDNEDWLKISTGILSLGFAVYCLLIVLVLWGTAAELSLLYILCLAYGIIYLIYGISILFRKKGRNVNFLPFVFAVGTSFWLTNMPWYMWPLFIVPFIILGLTIMMIIRIFKGGMVERDW